MSEAKPFDTSCPNCGAARVEGVRNCPNSCCLSKSSRNAVANGERVGVSPAITFVWTVAVFTSVATMIAASRALSMRISVY